MEAANSRTISWGYSKTVGLGTTISPLSATACGRSSVGAGLRIDSGVGLIVFVAFAQLFRDNALTEYLGLFQSQANWITVAEFRKNAVFADNRKFSRVLANCGYVRIGVAITVVGWTSCPSLLAFSS
jgi:hypothetical protein